MIYDKLVQARDEARRNKETREVGVLNTIIGECQRKERIERNGDYVTGDVACVSVLKKLKEASVFNMSHITDQDAVTAIMSEIEIIQRFLPVEMSVENLQAIASEHADLKSYMAFLKSNHAGTYDGKLASDVFKAKA